MSYRRDHVASTVGTCPPRPRDFVSRLDRLSRSARTHDTHTTERVPYGSPSGDATGSDRMNDENLRRRHVSPGKTVGSHRVSRRPAAAVSRAFRTSSGRPARSPDVAAAGPILADLAARRHDDTAYPRDETSAPNRNPRGTRSRCQQPVNGSRALVRVNIYIYVYIRLHYTRLVVVVDTRACAYVAREINVRRQKPHENTRRRILTNVATRRGPATKTTTAAATTDGYKGFF